MHRGKAGVFKRRSTSVEERRKENNKRGGTILHIGPNNTIKGQNGPLTTAEAMDGIGARMTTTTITSLGGTVAQITTMVISSSNRLDNVAMGGTIQMSKLGAKAAKPAKAANLSPPTNLSQPTRLPQPTNMAQPSTHLASPTLAHPTKLGQSCCNASPAQMVEDCSMDMDRIQTSSGMIQASNFTSKLSLNFNLKLHLYLNLLHPSLALAGGGPSKCQCCASFICLGNVPKASIASLCTSLPRVSARMLLFRH